MRQYTNCVKASTVRVAASCSHVDQINTSVLCLRDLHCNETHPHILEVVRHSQEDWHRKCATRLYICITVTAVLFFTCEDNKEQTPFSKG